MVQEKIHLQEKNIIWPWGNWPWPQGQGHMKCCLVPSTSCDLCAGKIWRHYEEMRFQENTLFDLWPWPKTPPWHHVTYAQAKFEVANSKSLWGDAFTRKYIIWPWGQGQTKCHPVPSTSCDLCTYKVSSCYVQLQETWRTDRQTDRRTDDGPTLIRN